jgi:hypothetical protein
MNQQFPPVPPVQSVELAETPSKWPTVFGVIGIILAALGLLNGCCGLGSPILINWFAGFLEGQEGVSEQDVANMRAAIPPVLWIIPASLVTLILNVILMVGAIRLLRRLSSGVGLCKFWAWFTIPWSLVGFVVGMYFQMQVPQQSQQMGGAAGQYIGLAIGGCMVLVLGVALPLFALYWFMREPVRAEIALWDEERRGVI